MSFKHTNLVNLLLVELDSTRLSGRSLQVQKFYVSVTTNRKMFTESQKIKEQRKEINMKEK